MDSAPVLIVGASRGIGAELVRQYLAAGHRVHATVRDVADPGELATVTGDLVLHRLDVRDEAGITGLAGAVAGAELAVAIHNAGVYQGHSAAEMMQVNAAAPLRVAEALLARDAMGPDGVLALMTSQLGARRGTTGSLGPYGESKAALNDGFRRCAPDWRRRGVIAVVIHPGWVRTAMGGSGAPLSVEESVTGIRRLIAGLTADEHGRFWTWDGREHPW